MCIIQLYGVLQVWIAQVMGLGKVWIHSPLSMHTLTPVIWARHALMPQLCATALLVTCCGESFCACPVSDLPRHLVPQVLY